MQFQLKSTASSPDRESAKLAAKPGVSWRDRQRASGFTLMEVIMAMLIVVMLFGGIINGYLTSATRGQWTGYSLAAQSLGLQTIEQARSAKWDGTYNELILIPLLNSSYNSTTKTYSGYTTNILDIPWKGTNAILATNYVTIRMFNENNDSTIPVRLQMIRVDTVWPFTGWGNFSVKYYTNTICTLAAPDNRDPTDLGATPPPQD
jgi:type II secretory pathway pseudopilin PulG